MVPWSTVAVILLACAVYAAFCAAVTRAFFRPRSDRASYRAAAAWAANFAVVVIGSLVVSDALGTEAAASFAVCACLASFALCLALDRWWRNRDMAAVAYLQLHRPLPAPVPAPEAPSSPWDASLASTCAHLARAYDLTRREEDVLRLLMEGCTFAQAADKMVVSLNTVKSHVRHIYAKIGVSGKRDLLEKVARDA